MIIKLHKQITIKCSAFVISLCFLFLTGCCSPQYSYYNCRKRGEEALIAKKFIKARNYYSLIYKNENKAKKVNEERTTWAYYRLGVIAEVSGDLKLAKGYYWGDSLREGFYDHYPQTGRLAKIGWKNIDDNKSARTLESILELEKNSENEIEIPEQEVIERKKEVIVPKKNSFISSNDYLKNTEDVIIKTYSDSRTPPPRNDPEPYQVYY